MSVPVFPFGDVVGQEDAKLALVLATVDPRIGGALLRGHKGTAKTTLARGLAALLDGAPFVEVPLGATEDRLVGTLDAAAALGGEGFRFRAGLLAEAHGGVLYVDEINLLADHLVDTLLDVSVSGENIIERDGISHRHPARFVLVGSMNPEEGELRPQLLDRFGFCVDMTTPIDIAGRVEALRRRLRFDGHLLDAPVPDTSGAGDGFATGWSAIRDARPAVIPGALLESAARLSVEVGAEGLRADLTLCRAAAALAGVEGRTEAGIVDMRRVARLVLAHRRRRGPFDPPVMEPEELDRALSATLDESRSDPRVPGPEGKEEPEEVPRSEAEADGDGGSGSGTPGPGPGRSERPLAMGGVRSTPTPASGRATAERGRFIRDVAVGEGHPVAVSATARALAGRRAHDPSAFLGPDDLRAEVRVARKLRTCVLCVDLSGSMGAGERARAATGMVLGLLADAYQRRDRVALVGFRGDEAKVLLTPTSSIEVATNRLQELVTGGETPLAIGILRGVEVAGAAGADGSETLLVLLTDGRATGGPDAVDAAMDAAAAARHRGIPAMVLDCEPGPVRLHLAERIAEAMGARYVRADDLDPVVLTDTVRGMART